MTFGFFV